MTPTRIARLGRQLVMQTLDGEAMVTVDSLIADVGKRYGVSLAEIKGPCRRQVIVEARRAAIRMLAELGYPHAEIGRLVCRDHKTVYHHLKGVA